MPVKHRLWTVEDKPTQVASTTLVDERALEDMIVAAPEILSDEWMLIGRQEATDGGGRADLVAIAPDASLILIELKRDKTPRDVIAQTLDYASWLSGISAEDVAAMYERFRPGRSLGNDFRSKFAAELDEDAINETHQLVVVSSIVDSRTERIVRYLTDLDVPINLLSFDVFEHGETQFLSRVWFLDPMEAQANASEGTRAEREPWNGEFYACFGHDETRSWGEAVQYGFLSAGGGGWYSGTLSLLAKGSRVWVKAPTYGFVGVGLVTGPRQSALEFMIDNKPALEVLEEGHYHRECTDDLDRMEYFVPIRWLDHVPIENAVDGVGLFGNQNTVCRPRTAKWRSTVERLKMAFPNHDGTDGHVG
ncbi:MAG: nuclease [Gemmatimonadota bacterium]|nr:hypothetical protein [Caldilineaceae bacterium]MDE2773995.1 nuclease [Gemmatimonadota bacterium]